MTVQNLIDLFETHDPGSLHALRDRFPEAGDLFRWDRPLGGKGRLAGDARPRRDLADAGCALLRTRTDAIISALGGRLRRAQRLKTAGAVLAALSNAGLIASLTQAARWGPPTVNVLLAVTAFSGSMLAVFAERAAGGASGGRIGDLFEQAVQISSHLLKEDLCRQRLIAAGAAPEDWDKLLSALDELALPLHEIEIKARVA